MPGEEKYGAKEKARVLLPEPSIWPESLATLSEPSAATPPLAQAVALVRSTSGTSLSSTELRPKSDTCRGKSNSYRRTS